MQWVKLAVLFLEAAFQFSRWVQRERAASDIQREILEQTEGRIREQIQLAEAERARVRGGFVRDPGSLRDADKYLRPD